jgi:RNA polymerase sigma-70 factor (ECF subfamily)
MYEEASEDLIARARREPAAFGELYDLYLNRVYAFCLSRTGDEREAEDLTAHTFERALSAIGRYEGRGAPFSSWLFRIAANLMIDRGRRSGRFVPMGDNPAMESASEDPEDNPAALVERWERAAALREQMAKLPDDQQEALRLRYWEGLSTFDLANRLNRSEGAVKQLLHRAVLSLRSRLQDERATGV